MERPTFYTKKGFPIRAGGVMFYTLYNNEIYIMIQEIINRTNLNDSNKNNSNKNNSNKNNSNKNIWSDLGGKTEFCDKTLDDTICREVLEETNNRLFYLTNKQRKLKDSNIHQLKKLKLYVKKNTIKNIVIPNSKYLLYLVKFDCKNFNRRLLKPLIYTNQHKTNQHKTNQHKTNQHKTNQHKTNQHNTNQSKTNQPIKWIKMLDTIEYLTQIPRKIGWVSLTNFLEELKHNPKKIHIRLRNKYFYNSLYELKKVNF